MSRYLLILLLLIFNIKNLSCFYDDNLRSNDTTDYYQTGSEKIKNNKPFKRYLKTMKNNENYNFQKIDILSNSLRNHIDNFRNDSDMMDIVFLIDASSSVGHDNFQSELNFVRKVLSDLSIDETSTKIAIITFAGKRMIIKNIDQISKNNYHGNKCTLLNEELNNINYTGGATYTRGALLETLKILKNSRENAKKVVFLITDGFSNGGDPKPVSILLKNIGTTILTFGIRTGNVEELDYISTQPGHTHSYFLDSFKEFQVLAHHALHHDLQVGKYIRLKSKKSCQQLCSSLNVIVDNNNKTIDDCCDKIADCTCGSTSGHLACLCPTGYYGSGLQGSCHPCPNGTYGQVEISGDSSEHCVSCPNVNHVTLKIPAISADDCVCGFGYTTNGSNCEAITCPKLIVPENGYLVKSNCNNAVNAACGLRCKIGFRLVGNSIKLCRIDGTWSGIETQCLLKTCPIIRAPTHGQIECQHDDDNNNYNIEITNSESLAFPIDTQCKFKCDHGYQLLGSKFRNCLPVSRWDGLKVSCKQIKCEPLKPFENGKIIPEICTGNKKLNFGTNCTITCLNGFTLEGPAKRKCGGNRGLWSHRKVINQCIDKVPPVIVCPKNSVWKTVDGKKYSLPTWLTPTATDNSGKEPSIWIKPHLVLPWKSKIGFHTITYIAQDASGNKAKCRFIITTIDKEPPTIENCKDPPIFQSTNSKGAENVTWDEPRFYDNSEKKVLVTKNYELDSFFPIGHTQIIYNAIDSSDNKINCIINITVENSCKNHPVISNGQTNCHENNDGIIKCVVKCNEGFIFDNPIDNEEIILTCDTKTAWNNSHTASCSRIEYPTSFEFGGSVYLDSKNNSICHDEKLNNHVNYDIEKKLINLCEKNGVNCQSLKSQLLNCSLIKKIRNKRLTTNQYNDTKIKKICEKGKIIRKNKCIKCQAGTFHNLTKNICQACSLSEYQDKPSSIICQKCPDKMSTKRTRSANKNDCIAICQPGKYSRKKYHKDQKYSMEPCHMCDIGFYQSNYGKYQCQSCPKKTTTLYRGSTSIQHCIPIENINFCHSESCLNNGKCINEYSGFSCECSDRFIGSRCEKLRNYCDSSPCLNEGTCIPNENNNLNNYYTCKCKDNYSGDNCEIYIDECTSNPCLNNATCISSDNDFFCNCTDDFTGENCEIPLNPCQAGICEQGSTCLTTINGTWYCQCKPGSLGRHCELLPCDWLPCHPNAICINIMDQKTTINSYKCECPLGYEGDDCTIKINHCKKLPCQNDGICLNNLHNYTCQCQLAFDGINCQEKLTSDYLINFDKPGITDYVLIPGPKYNLTEFTICLWLQSTDKFNYGTIFSYATDNQDNEITLNDYNGLVFYIKGQRIITDIILNNGQWYFLCVTWESSRGTWFIYVNGIIRESGIDFLKDQKIQANGSIVIGQEQDTLNGKFSSSESFIGNITLLDIFNTTLTDEKIKYLTNTCDDYYGTLIPWSSIQKFIKGNIKILKSTFCHDCLIPLNYPSNFIINITNDKSELHISCQTGYKIAYNNDNYKHYKKKCLKNGSWESYDDIICQKIYCGHPEYINNGQINGQSFYHDDLITYTCDEGFNIYGNNSRVCNDDGNWSGKSPSCIGVICNDIGMIDNGEIKIIDKQLMANDDSENLKIIQAGQSIEFNCHMGFKLIGNNTLTCNESGQWNFDKPICYPVGCLTPKIPSHSSINISLDLTEKPLDVYEFNDILEIFCDNGFKFDVDDNQSEYEYLKCHENGSWIGSIPNCIPLRCPLPNITNGIIKNIPEETVPGEKLKIECHDGYELHNNTNIYCEETEKWSQEIPICIIKKCQNITSHIIAGLFVAKSNINNNNLNNYRLAIIGDKYNDKLILHCVNEDNNFVFNLTNGLIKKYHEIMWICDENGNWMLQDIHLNDEELKELLVVENLCSGVTCQPPILSTNVILIDKNNSSVNKETTIWKINSTVKYKCKNGFILEGVDVSTCMSTGLWSGFALCRPGNCTDPLKLQNAETIANGNYQIGKIIQYKCLPGHRLVGQGTSECLANGKWSIIQGRCPRISCGKPSVSSNITLSGKSYLYQEQLTFKCQHSNLIKKITCMANGKWSKLPSCN
ncbi:sushi, von Willebrand factor type A, EGF and pentraxin domain-containing protein 1-like [Aphidius gifuensis]|uniref:sushi, von Willebrand factor type A, EGF and pentraxin domain-containing protein 1-like n=1 Tax=Aphidius gifuensis TaxID=684658 RepID=UPI001CDD16F1|nr:sushi, von Willebrand factor type A, EGF and pentraxin domain-containing protein 1-like [Aphidius gifuensis]